MTRAVHNLFRLREKKDIAVATSAVAAVVWDEAEQRIPPLRYRHRAQ